MSAQFPTSQESNATVQSSAPREAEGIRSAGGDSGAPPVDGAAACSTKLAAEPSEAEALEFARATHANLQDMVKVADAKATSLVALQALVLAFIGPELIAALAKALTFWKSEVPWFWLKTEGCLLIVGALLGVLIVLSALAAVWVLKPRFPQHLTAPGSARGLMWIDALLPFVEREQDLEPRLSPSRSPGDYVHTLRRMSPHERLADFAFENLKVAWILRRKFRWLNWAVLLLAAAFAAGTLMFAAWTLFTMKHPPTP